jgi:hypothetical protein
VPQAPTIGTATGGNASATVAFTANANGGKTVSTFTATSSPGSITGSSATSPITVSGLTNGTAYTFTVTATNANGVSTASAASNSVTPAVPTAYESIATATGTGSSNTITFSNISGTYQHLQIRAMVKNTNSSAIGTAGLTMRLNSDTASNYTQNYLRGDGSSVSAGGFANQTSMYCGECEAGGDASIANRMGVVIVDIHDYASTTKNKTVRCFSGADLNSTQGYVNLTSGLWRSTSAVTSITFIAGSNNFNSQTVFALYGIKGS